MKTFMGKNFLLTTDTAKELFHDYAENMPIIDYHCHINPKEIYEDRKFENITQVWLGGDHYKWRQMRSNGVAEKYVTGDGSDREKFQAWANGPVCPELYARHRGEFNVTPGEFRGDPGVLDKSQRDTVDAVLGYYGTLSAYELSTLTHREAPWKDARGDIEPGQRSNNVISNASMAEYYGSLTD